LARIAFLALDYLPAIGPGILTGVVRRAGHQAQIFFMPDRVFAKDLARFDPDLIGMSVTSGKVKSCLAMAKWLKLFQPRARIVVGGAHPTFSSQMISDENVDFIIRGEAERAIIDLMEALDLKRSSFEGVRGLVWTDENGEIQQEPLAELVEDLDELPFPDWTPYFARRRLSLFYRRGLTMLSSRGCPFHCTYCQAEAWRTLYERSKFLRRRSVENVLQEIEELKKKYSVASVRFDDDDFAQRSEWLRKFADQCDEGRGLPFSCNLTARNTSDKVAAFLRRAGCYMVSIGLESGDSHIRREVMCKDLDDEDIINAAKALKKHGIMVQTYNLFGVPEETFETALSTWRLNRKIMPDFAWCSLFQPYPGTKLHERILRENNMQEEDLDFPQNYFERTTFRDRRMSRITAVQKLTQVLLWFRAPETVARFLAGLGDNSIYRMVFWFSYTIAQIKTKRLSIFGSFVFAFINRPSRWKPPKK